MNEYKTEILRRIEIKRKRIRERRRSALSLSYPLALLFVFLLLFFPGRQIFFPRTDARNAPFVDSNPVASREYTDLMRTFLPGLGVSFPDRPHPGKDLPNGTLLNPSPDSACSDGGYGGGTDALIEGALPVLECDFGPSRYSTAEGTVDFAKLILDALRYGEGAVYTLADVLPQERSVPRVYGRSLSSEECSLFRWHTGDGAYLVVSHTNRDGKVTLLFPILCELLSDAKPIPRRLTEETLAKIETNETENT